jgi:hypothetical protein
MIRFARIGKLYRIVRMLKLMRLMSIVKKRNTIRTYLTNALNIGASLERLLFMLITYLVL